MRNSFYPFLIFSLSSFILQSCGPTYNVDIDSISAPEAGGKTKYVLYSGHGDRDMNDIQFCEFASYTDRALFLAGFEKANDTKEADIAIFLDYNVSEPKTYEYTYSLPIYGQTGISSSTTNSTLNAYGNTANYSSTTEYKPSYGVIGSTTHVGTGVIYYYSLGVFGWDYREYLDNKKEIMLWETRAHCSGKTDDLRLVFPIMLGASTDYIGRSTQKRIKVGLTEGDQRVKKVKGIEEKSIVDTLMMR